mmetsp:Transcript_30927/g.66415  ORF Transcript_30927/g.66415 Transcript_30927/m.66415 type:complete len:216 (-) Transcript_30927:18-665(-)
MARSSTLLPGGGRCKSGTWRAAAACTRGKIKVASAARPLRPLRMASSSPLEPIVARSTFTRPPPSSLRQHRKPLRSSSTCGRPSPSSPSTRPPRWSPSPPSTQRARFEWRTSARGASSPTGPRPRRRSTTCSVSPSRHTRDTSASAMTRARPCSTGSITTSAPSAGAASDRCAMPDREGGGGHSGRARPPWSARGPPVRAGAHLGLVHAVTAEAA